MIVNDIGHVLHSIISKSETYKEPLIVGDHDPEELDDVIHIQSIINLNIFISLIIKLDLITRF